MQGGRGHLQAPRSSSAAPDVTSNPVPVSAATIVNGTTMTNPPGTITGEEIEDLVTQNVKEQKGRVMQRLRDRAPPPFAPEILAITVPPHVKIPRIDYYRGEGDTVERIQRHETSLFG